MAKDSGNGAITDSSIAELALKQSQLGEEWLAFSKEQFGVSTARQAELDALTSQVTQYQLDEAQKQSGYAESDRQRYETTFKPIEDQFIAEASNYGSAENQDAAAATAKADVTTAVSDAKAQGERQAFGYGINPGSGRYAGIQRAGDMTGALATAGAQNVARQGVRDKGLALKGEVVNLGRALPGQSAQAASLGLGAGASAVGLNQNNQNIFNNSPGIVGAGYGGAAQGYGSQMSTLSNLYNSQQQSDSANSQGLWGAVGTVAGAALPFMLSSEEYKEDKVPIEDGAALQAVNDMPVENWKYKDGIADGGEHVGPYAEDFAAATGKGDGSQIPMQDAIGVTMRAVQDLDKKIEMIAEAVGLGGSAGPKPTQRRKPQPTRGPVAPTMMEAPGLAQRAA